MKKIVLTFFSLLAFVFCSFSQEITAEKVLTGYRFTQNGQQLSLSDLENKMISNKEAFPLIKKAKTKNVFAIILGGTGGALIGYPLGQAISSDDADWELAGIGAGLIGIAIPLSSSSSNKAKEAVDIYNQSLNE